MFCLKLFCWKHIPLKQTHKGSQIRKWGPFKELLRRTKGPSSEHQASSPQPTSSHHVSVLYHGVTYMALTWPVGQLAWPPLPWTQKAPSRALSPTPISNWPLNFSFTFNIHYHQRKNGFLDSEPPQDNTRRVQFRLSPSHRRMAGTMAGRQSHRHL